MRIAAAVLALVCAQGCVPQIPALTRTPAAGGGDDTTTHHGEPSPPDSLPTPPEETPETPTTGGDGPVKSPVPPPKPEGQDNGAPGIRELTITWAPPTNRVDGSPLSPIEIAGYYVRWGRFSGLPTFQSDLHAGREYRIEWPRSMMLRVYVEAVDIDGRRSGYSEELELP